MDDSKKFVHLHNHSEFSILDGAARVADMAKKAAELGCPAIALTDHGRMAGLVSFYMECQKAGVKPICGMEAYITGMGRSRKDRVNYTADTKDHLGRPGREKTAYHLILQAKNQTGYDNLCLLTTESYATGYYYKPRIDYELLERHHEGLIVSSACVLGELSDLLLNNDYKKAREVALWYKNLFGDDYYIEVMNHGLEMERYVTRPLRELADELGIKTIVTNDAHYVEREDQRIQKSLMLLTFRKSWSDSDVSGSFFDDAGFVAKQGEIEDSEGGGEVDPIFETEDTLYLRTYDEMVEANIIEGGDGGRVQQELANTLEIAEKVEFEMPIIDASDTSQYFLPDYPIETDVKYDEYAESDYVIPDYIVDTIIDKLHELGSEDVNDLSEYLRIEEIEALRFLCWMCERNLERLVRPKIEARGEPLPMSFWIENPPSGFTVDHAHNSPDEVWIKTQLARGNTAEDIMQKYRDRLAYELSIVVAKHFIMYFLLVSSYVSWTKSTGASVGPGRGSGAGALLNYLSDITAVDPLPNDLMFERFLNPERSGYPDIDCDFSGVNRAKLWEHLRSIYGIENTSGVAAYTFFWGKAAIKAAARVLFDCSNDKRLSSELRKEGKNTSVSLSNALCDLIDNAPKLDLNNELDGSNPALDKLIASDKRYRQIIDLALILQGRISGESQHASAYIISPHPIIDRMPLMVNKDERAESQKTGERTTNFLIQFDGRAVQDQLGYVKLDLLAINDLEVIDNALRIVERQYGCKIDIENIPFDDKAAFDLVAEGHTSGIFQFDGSSVPNRLIRESKADRIADWSAINALNRPGSLQMGYDKQFVEGKLHPESIHYFTPAAEPYLKETYGTVPYQEILMLLSQDKNIVGFTGGQSDNMRKILAHKDKAKIQGIVDLAHDVAASNGVSTDVVDQFCEIAVAAGSYSFNKSHALAYALIAYRGAFIKSHFPECFLASMCTLKPQMKGKDKVPDYLEDARQLGVTVKPPHVNYSMNDFDVPEKGVIAFGLGGIKRVGQGAAPIIAEREVNGPFKDFTDFCTRVPKQVGKGPLEALIKAGALDGLGWSRMAMEESIDQIVDFRKRWFAEKEKKDLFADDLFGFADDTDDEDPGIELVAPFDTEYSERELMNKEKEQFGMYFEKDPRDFFRVSRYLTEKRLSENARTAFKAGAYDHPRFVNAGEAITLPDKTLVQFVANIGEVKAFRTKKGDMMASVYVWDNGVAESSRFGFAPTKSTIKCTIFPKTWANTTPPLVDDVVVITGRVSVDPNGEWPTAILVDKIEQLRPDTDWIGSAAPMSRAQEYAEAYAEMIARDEELADPSSARYMIPVLSFKNDTDLDAFLLDPDLEKYRGDGRVMVTVVGDESGKREEIVSLKQTRGMVAFAARYGAIAAKTRLPKAQRALERRAMMSGSTDDAPPAGQTA